MVRKGKPTRRERETHGNVAFNAFMELYGLSNKHVKDFAHNFHNASEPYRLASRFHQALIPSKLPLVRKLDNLDEAVTNLGKLLDRVPKSPECEGVFLFNYEDGKLKNLGVKRPEFEDYVHALEVAGAWKGKRPSDDEIKGMDSFGILSSIATYFPDEYQSFIDTEGYQHIRDFSRVIRGLFESTITEDSPEGNPFPAQRIGLDVLTSGMDHSKFRSMNEKLDLEADEIIRLLNDPEELNRRLHGDKSSEGVLQHADHYDSLDSLLDLQVLESIPYSGITGPEHVMETAQRLEVLKGDKVGNNRSKTVKILLGLLSSTDQGQRADLLDMVARSETEQEVDSLELYSRLKNTGLKPEEFIEFLRAGDQFGWRPEGSDTALSTLTGEYYKFLDPVDAYLTAALSNFNLLDELDKITSKKSSVPAAKELMLNPSLLFLDDNAVELMTLARDYNQGRLIIERYATVMAEGLHERAEAVLHVGQLRPSRLDLKFIRERMRSLDEQEMGSVVGCKSTEELKDLLKSKEKNTTQKPSHIEGISWFNLMKKRMNKRGATEENIHSVEEAHELLSDNGGNPRLLRNMFRTQPRNLVDLCSHIKIHSEDETFGVMMQRDALFQRYKLGLATVDGFSENFSEFVSQEHPNPFQALQGYLPQTETDVSYSDDINEEVVHQETPPLSESTGKIFLCGGIFRGDAKRKLEEEFPNLSLHQCNHSGKIYGLGNLSSEDTVVWVRQNSGHNIYHSTKNKCQKSGANFLEVESDGLSSIRRFLTEPLKKKSHSTESAS